MASGETHRDGERLKEPSQLLVSGADKDAGEVSKEPSRRNALVPGMDRILLLGSKEDNGEESRETSCVERPKESLRRNASDSSKDPSRAKGSKAHSRQNILVSQDEVELAIKRLREFLLARLGTKVDVFKKLDSNGNGDVSYEELKTSLRDLNCPVDELCGQVTLKRIFKELDIDGRNALSVKELLTANPWQVEEEAVGLLRHALMAQFPTKRELLAAFDEDKTGSISFGELEKSLRLYGISVEEATGGCDLGRLFDFLDSDCSGELTMYELFESDPREAAKERDTAIVKFRQALLERWGSKQDVMRALDTNSNGMLSYLELQGGLQRNHISIREICGNKDFKWFFRVLDVDGSGQLSSKELIDLDPAREIARLAASRRKRAKRSMIKSISAPRPKKGQGNVDGDGGLADAKIEPISEPIDTTSKSMSAPMTGKEAEDVDSEEGLADKYDALLAKYNALKEELLAQRKVRSKPQTIYVQVNEQHTQIKHNHRRLEQDRKNFKNDLEETCRSPQEDELRMENELLKTELRLLKEDHALLTRRHNKLRIGLNEDWHMLSTGGTIEDAARPGMKWNTSSSIAFPNGDVSGNADVQQDFGAAGEQGLSILQKPFSCPDKRTRSASGNSRARQDLPFGSIENAVAGVRRRRQSAWGDRPGASFVERTLSSVQQKKQVASSKSQMRKVSEHAGQKSSKTPSSHGLALECSVCCAGAVGTWLKHCNCT